ncbi:5'-Nucleotidase domain protein [Staphylococcus aureus subsp. aureus ECT-R 2]|nr:5'-Nucleotidase domain protein [Staphylococcus aureus subsp. aureus ECT-R 2]
MSNIAFYVVSDVHGYIFPTDFTSRNQYQPMGIVTSESCYRTRQKAV